MAWMSKKKMFLTYSFFTSLPHLFYFTASAIQCCVLLSPSLKMADGISRTAITTFVAHQRPPTLTAVLPP